MLNAFVTFSSLWAKQHSVYRLVTLSTRETLITFYQITVVVVQQLSYHPLTATNTAIQLMLFKNDYCPHHTVFAHLTETISPFFSTTCPASEDKNEEKEEERKEEWEDKGEEES